MSFNVSNHKSAGEVSKSGFFSDDGDVDSKQDIVAEINITPLVDVMLVLLIIFMVTSSVMSQSGQDVTLPKSTNAGASKQPKAVVITLLKNGDIRVNNEAVDPSQDLATKIQEAFQKTTSRMIVMEGDQDVFLGKAVQVMDAAKKAGADQFSIATESSAR